LDRAEIENPAFTTLATIYGIRKAEPILVPPFVFYKGMTTS
jgi:hypothetical protein